MASLDEMLAAIAVVEESERMNDAPRRKFHVRDDAFELSDIHFIRLFRLSKEMVIDLIDILEPYLMQPSRSSALTAETKVLTALRFYALGSYQMDTASNVTIAISQTSASRSIREVTNALNHPNVFNKWVKFPSNIHELNLVRQGFYDTFNFPGVIGCIDCTHVAIFPPPVEDPTYPEHLYVNRKGYHSINVQLVCDAYLRIINVNAKYPGSTNDAFVWNNSKVLTALKNLNRSHKSYYLLGDSGYALRPWLLTPIKDDPETGTPEASYNKKHKTTRCIIERVNGVLKMRFRCLLKHRVLHYKPEVASKMVNACVVLHNMCIASNLPDPEPEPGDEELDFGLYEHDLTEDSAEDRVVRRVLPELVEGRKLRNSIIRNYFTRL